MAARHNAVVIGAGALGLGFLGPELSPDATVWFLDTDAKRDVLACIERDRAYTVNLADVRMRPVRVEHARACVVTDDPARAADILAQADLCVTCVGASNLGAVAPLVRRAARMRDASAPLPVLCAENHRHAADVFAQTVGDGENVVTSDTVMSRMCRWVATTEHGVHGLFGPPGQGTAQISGQLGAAGGGPHMGVPNPPPCQGGVGGGCGRGNAQRRPDPPPAPPYEGGESIRRAPLHRESTAARQSGHTPGPAVVAEAFYGIPYRCREGLPDLPFGALQALEQDRFALVEDAKLFGHNCVHGLFAFGAARRGLARIHEVADDAELNDRARRLLYDELMPALAKRHPGVFGRSDYLNYAVDVVRRIVSPTLGDTVDRGVRGASAKLGPDGRWVAAVRFVREAGVAPIAYGRTIADAIAVSGLLDDRDRRTVLADHCGFSAEEIDAMGVADET